MNLEKADGIAKYACLLAGTANQAKAELIIRGAISQRHAGSGDPAYNAVGRVPSRGVIYGAMHRREDGFSQRVNVPVHSTPFPFAYLEPIPGGSAEFIPLGFKRAE